MKIMLNSFQIFLIKTEVNWEFTTSPQDSAPWKSIKCLTGAARILNPAGATATPPPYPERSAAAQVSRSLVGVVWGRSQAYNCEILVGGVKRVGIVLPFAGGETLKEQEGPAEPDNPPTVPSRSSHTKENLPCQVCYNSTERCVYPHNLHCAEAAVNVIQFWVIFNWT